MRSIVESNELSPISVDIAASCCGGILSSKARRGAEAFLLGETAKTVKLQSLSAREELTPRSQAIVRPEILLLLSSKSVSFLGSWSQPKKLKYPTAPTEDAGGVEVQAINQPGDHVE